MQLNIKRLAAISAVLILASCGQTAQPAKNVVKIENGVVKTRYFSITIPEGWRVATSETTEVRDTYYPDQLKPLQRFQAYDPNVFTKNVEIGIYKKEPPVFKDFLSEIKTLSKGLEFIESEVDFNGLKLTKIEPKDPMFAERPVVLCGQGEDFYIHIYTQNTYDDLTQVIETFRLTPKDEWKPGDVSQAETSTSGFFLIGGKYDTKFAKCQLPNGWKVKTETDISVVFLPGDDSKKDQAMDCTLNPYIRDNEKLEDVVKRYASALTKPIIEEVKLGNNAYTKLSNPEDGTGRSMYFTLSHGKIYTFRVTTFDKDIGDAQQQILATIEMK